VGIGLLLELGAALAPDRVAVGAATDHLTFAELDARVDAAVGAFRASGARSVAYLGLSGPALHVAIFAAGRAGLPITPLNYRMADTHLAEMLGRLDAPLVVADEPNPRAAAGHPLITTTDMLHLPGHGGRALPDDISDDAPAVVMFTSGTTSVPKGVVLRHVNLVSYVLQTVDPGSAGPEEAALVCVPPYHIAGVGTVLTNTAAGRRMVHLPDFTPQGWLRTVAEQRITSAMVVPTMLSRIVDYLDGGEANLPTLRSIAYGGSRIPPPVLGRALRAFPNAGFVNAYGLTETSSTIALLGPEDHRAAMDGSDPVALARLASVGKFVPGVEGQIRDSEGVAPAGKAGELWVRGAQISGDYLGSGSVVDTHGWFPTRDRAYLDADGYLFVEGRTDDVIIRGGENIAPAEIEDVLFAHPAVRAVAIVGLPDHEWGERIVAVVVARTPISATDLREFVRARLRSSRTPDQVLFVDELPMSPAGKLLRREVIRTVTSRTLTNCCPTQQP
jgi:acyl-CoA synthetase (AMP-forming)/AMP-acid ligase II